MLYNTTHCLTLCKQLILCARSDNSRLDPSQRECAFRELNSHANKIDDGGVYDGCLKNVLAPVHVR